MSGASVIPPPTALPWRFSPAEAIAAWPADRPLAALSSGGWHRSLTCAALGDRHRLAHGSESRAARWSRWSILAEPVESMTADVEEGLAGLAPALDVAGGGSTSAAKQASPVPFAGGWIGWLGYDLGRSIEPKAEAPGGKGAADDRGWPAAELLRCPGAYVYDHLLDQWWACGDRDALPEIEKRTAETVRPQVAQVTDLCSQRRFGHASTHGSESRATNAPLQIGDLVSSMDESAFTGAVAEALERIAAGDIFQVNLARRLSAAFEGSPRALFRRMLTVAEPWYGGFVESPDRRRSVLSISPELFFEVDPATRRVVTRPVKGTLPADHSPEQLRNSEKDRAELVMIVDLMRNDLGRLCEFGSVRVEQAQAIERHGGAGSHRSSGVLHGVATVAGTLRREASLADLIAATFPAGSVTGAPKIRAMQIIDELEPVRRGPYCGAVGFIGDDGRMCLNVGIRTASVSGAPVEANDAHVIGTVDYSVGAGIVADSEPDSEWRETEAKAAGFRRAVESFSEAEARAEAPA